MTIRATRRETYAGTPVPVAAKEQADKLGGKAILSVDLETGEIKWDEEMEDKMGFRVEVSKDDFLKAVKNNKSQAGAIRELNIGVSTFYKYKKMWAADIAEMDKPRGMTINPDFEKAIREMEEAGRRATVGREVESVDPEPEEIHTPTPAEVEDFFEEPETFNPEEPKKKEGNRVNALKAFDLMEQAREESYCVTTIFDQIIPITPAIRDLLANYRTETEMIVDEIEQKLGELTIRL